MSKRTRIMALVGVMLVGAFMVFMGVGGFAANPTVVSVSATVSATAAMELSMTSPVNWGGVQLVPSMTPYTSLTTATVHSNKVWSMNVLKDHDLTDASAHTIPSANLTYTVSSGDPKVLNKQASGTQFGITSSNVCNTCTRGAATLDVNYSLLVPFDAVEAVPYTAGHTYTVTQP